jgi:ATP-dependent DNA helicase RecG
VQRLIDALRRPLLEAAAADVREVRDGAALGEALRVACDRALAAMSASDRAPFETWRRRLDGFEALDARARAVEVQRGLRLCQTLAGPAPARRAAPTRGEGLAAPVTELPGIGPALAEKLAERGIETVEDLAWLVPRRYDDLRRIRPLGEALAAAPVDGERVALWGRVASCRVGRKGARRWIDVRLADPDGAAGALAIRFFNVHGGMATRFPRGAAVAVSGVARRRQDALEMANPDVLAVSESAGEGAGEPPAAGVAPSIRPRYPDIAGVPAATLRKACQAAMARALAHLEDGIPASIAAARGLPGLAEALAALHAPPADLADEEVAALLGGTSRWHERLAFDELFVLGLAIARRRRERREGVARACPVPADRDEALARTLPFALTGAQRRAVEAIGADLARARPMSRLLQGDVGSGKTAVALAAARQVIAAGAQVALMAPTEILAEQHARALAPWCRELGIRPVLLTASTPRPTKASAYAMVEAGQLQLAIGTHALLAEGLRFAALGLVIIDEQHRFGVAQRARLRDKGDGARPHLLVMTATPIPRTLALTAYGDLDATVLDELPPGREPPTTRVISGAASRQKLYGRLRARLLAGHRAYVVCPLVEPSEEPSREGWADATSVHAELARALAPAKVGLVHGRLGGDERDQTMTAFRRGELHALVATTVIEVGVDVPEATVMIVEDADRFGLAQLHQLRGRVGRGGGEAHCVLLTRRGRTGDGARRLEVMAQTTDGFVIAEEDLALRGPGEVLGARQAGLPKLRFGELGEHGALLAEARAEADRLLERDPALSLPEHQVLRRVLEARTADGPIYGPDSG